MEAHQKIGRYWQRFLRETGQDPDLTCYECFAFCGGGPIADELLALVLEGKKTATSSSLRAYEVTGEPMPHAGCCSIVTDSRGEPHCVIQTTQVTVLPFREMTFALCRHEGEDDDLASWQRNHEKVFTRESAECGYAFDWDMPVVFERFFVVWRGDSESGGE